MSNVITEPKKVKAENGQQLVVNQIIIRPIDRSTKDIQSWRSAHQQAEQVVYANRTRLYDLYADVELDGHLTGIIQKRVDAVLNKTLHFTTNGQKVDEMDAVIESQVFRDIITEALKSKLWGLSALEFLPGEKLRFEPINRKHIKPDLGIIAKEQNGQEGWSYEGLDNVWIIGNKTDLGLLLKCAPYALWKRGNMADWAQYIEIFGQPVRICKYDAHDNETKIELQEVLEESGSSLALMIPKQADFEMLDGKQSNGDGKLQEAFKNACDNEMSIIILGNTETTSNSNGGSLAKTKEHSKQQLEVTKSDLKFVANLLNSDQFIKILQSYGYPVKGGKFEYEIEIDLDELAQRKDIDLAISAKVPVDDDYWYQTYGIPKPANYAELKKQMDDERMLKLAPPAAPAPVAGKKKVKIDSKDKKLSDEGLTFWDKFRSKLADFFDQAPKD